MEDGMGLVCILGIMAQVSLGYVPIWNNGGSFAWNVSIRVVCLYGALARVSLGHVSVRVFVSVYMEWFRV